jgi:hypothetical protein
MQEGGRSVANNSFINTSVLWIFSYKATDLTKSKIQVFSIDIAGSALKKMTRNVATIENQHRLVRKCSIL